MVQYRWRCLGVRPVVEFIGSKNIWKQYYVC